MARNRTSLLLAALIAGFAPQTIEAAVGEAQARETALEHLRASATERALSVADVGDVAVTDVVPTRHNGVTHVYLRQRFAGIEIDGTEMGIHVDRRGRVFHETGDFVAGVAAKAPPPTPRLSTENAVRAALRGLGFSDRGELVPTDDLLPAGAVVAYRNAELSEELIPLRLRYLRDGDNLRLAWNLSLKHPSTVDWWDVWVDAENGALLKQVNWTSHATYRVFASPKESPYDGARTDEVDPHLEGGTDPSTGASPYGWHDTDGVAGAESTLTQGNNVTACADTLDTNTCDPGSLPDGGPGLVFQPALDLGTQRPDQYLDAAVVNLFHWNNVMHDVTYQYGFDEAAGNFQVNNYGRGGAANDAVNAEAQDGSGFSNANFSTPGDGVRPRMQMYIWLAERLLEITAPPPIADFYNAGIQAGWGPTNYDVERELVLVNDGSGTVLDDGCCDDGNTLCTSPNWPGITGVSPAPIALLRRGQCEFGFKVVNAQNAGAAGVVLINNLEETIAMGPGAQGGNATIPAQSVALSDGNLFVANLPGVVARLNWNATTELDRDSDLDNGIIAHEYGHGISNRLTGGPATTSCLNNQEQMGEGWSDWMTLFLHALPADTATTSRPIGNYANFDPPTGPGIRRFPYNTDSGINPLTYGDIGGEAVPHGVGAVWANTLWEMYWRLVDQFGYDADIYDGTGGNNIAFQLVMDGMKLQPCRPGFVTGRDGILAADQADFDGDLACTIWSAFAERGLGAAASQGSEFAVGDEVEDFTLPAACVDLIFADSFGFGTDRWSAVSP